MSFESRYYATVGFTKIIDRTCPTCKGIFASREHSICPKCRVPLTIPMANTTKGPRPYCFTEVTIYPIMPKKDQESYLDRVKKSKSMLFSIRLKIWGKYDEANNIAVPNNLSQYLIPKKQVLVETNNPPMYSIYTAKDNVPMVQILHDISFKSGDKITLLGSKDAAVAQTVAPAPAPIPAPAPTEVKKQPTELEILGEQIKNVTAMFAAMAAKAATPAPAPAPVATVMTNTATTNPLDQPVIPDDMGYDDYDLSSGMDESISYEIFGNE